MQEDGGAEGASGLGAQPRCTSAPKATVGLAGCSSPPHAATESAASAEVVGGGEACLSPLGLSEGGGGAGAQHWLVNEGGREEADESLPAGEEGGGGEGSPHLFSLDGGEEEMEYCGAPEGGEAGRPRSLLSSSSDEESELRVQSGDEQVMEASDSAESFVTARKKESSRKHSGKLPGEGEGRKKKKKRI